MSTTPSTGSDRLFSKRAILAAVIGGVIFLVWAFISMQLPSSAFCKARVSEAQASDFASRVAGGFLLSGVTLGFVAYHLGRSTRRGNILNWMLVWGAVGAVVGGIVGALLPVGPGLAKITNGRLMLVLLNLVRGSVVAASISALFTSNKRRVILKSIFLPMALGLALHTVALSFVPVDVSQLNDPASTVDKLVTESAGEATGIVLLVGIVVACVRRFGGGKPGVQTPPDTAQPTRTP